MACIKACATVQSCAYRWEGLPLCEVKAVNNEKRNLKPSLERSDAARGDACEHEEEEAGRSISSRRTEEEESIYSLRRGEENGIEPRRPLGVMLLWQSSRGRTAAKLAVSQDDGSFVPRCLIDRNRSEMPLNWPRFQGTVSLLAHLSARRALLQRCCKSCEKQGDEIQDV